MCFMNIPRKEPHHEPLWTVEQLRTFLGGISKATVTRSVASGILPHVRFGDRVLFKPSSIRQLVRDREAGGNIPRPRGRRPRR
jgi:hypothetical protein